MVASRSARERKAAAQAGPLARVRIDVGADEQFVYEISCVECVVKAIGAGRRTVPVTTTGSWPRWTAGYST